MTKYQKLANSFIKLINPEGTFADVQEKANGGDSKFKGDFLREMNKMIGRVMTGNMLTQNGINPFIKYFYRAPNSPFGEVDEILVVLTAAYSNYTPKLDPNEHYIPENIKQFTQRVYRDKYIVSISPNLMKDVFKDPREFSNYIIHYNQALAKAIDFKGRHRFLKVFAQIPTQYKVGKTPKDGLKAIMLLASKMEQPKTYFNTKLNPTDTPLRDQVVLMNSKYYVDLQVDELAGIFNIKAITEGGKFGGVQIVDIQDPNIIFAIVDKRYSYYMATKFDEATSQAWAATLIRDNFHHEHVKFARIDAANSVVGVLEPKKGKIVDSEFDYTDIDGRTQIKDEIEYRDITPIVNGMVDESDNIVEMLSGAIQNEFMFEGAGDVPTKDEVLKAMKEANPLLREKEIDIISCSANMACVKPKSNSKYSVGSGREFMKVFYAYSKKGSTPPPKPVGNEK